MGDAVTLGKGRYLELVEREGWEYVARRRASGVAIVVALTADEQLVLVEQFRTPVAAPVLELPAGLVGDETDDEDVLAAASRELLEETGYEAGKMAVLVEGPSSPGLAAEEITFVGATDLRKVHEGGGVQGEQIVVRTTPLADAEAFFAARRSAGVLLDIKLYAGLYLAGRLRSA